jgi:hypothetical protein
MFRLFNSNGTLISQIKFNITSSEINFRLKVSRELEKNGLKYDFLKLKNSSLTKDNIKDFLGKTINGKWIGNGDFYGYYELDDQVIFSVVWKDYYLRGYIIEDDICEIEIIADYLLTEGLSEDLKFIIRDYKLNKLGI